jgi:hypothetical protein
MKFLTDLEANILIKASGLDKQDVQLAGVRLSRVLTRKGIYLNHPFLAGEVHQLAAQQTNGGNIDEDICRKFPCTWTSKEGIKCWHDFDDHINHWMIILKIPVVEENLGSFAYTIQRELGKLADMIEEGDFNIEGVGFECILN